MTYKQLLEILQFCPDEVLEQTATIYLAQTDEYVPVTETFYTHDSDVLDEGHLVIEANF